MFAKTIILIVLIYCCVLMVYNTLYKFVTTQRDGLCQKTENMPVLTLYLLMWRMW